MLLLHESRNRDHNQLAYKSFVAVIDGDVIKNFIKIATITENF